METAAAICAFLSLLAAQPAGQRAPDDDAAADPYATMHAIPAPHPIITEVLFRVPGGAGPEADANKDGARDAAGDEFVEIQNPHDEPVNLKGYTLADRNPEENRAFRFTFPDVQLAPGAIAVVFNGFGAKIPGPSGDSEKAAAPNPNFNGALVFDAKITSRNRALSNSGDFVVLAAPDGAPIEVVYWGSPDPAPPPEALRTSEADLGARGSVQRLGPRTPVFEHMAIDNRPFSPGEIPRINLPD